MKTRTFPLLATFLTFSLAVSACGDSSSDSETATPGGGDGTTTTSDVAPGRGWLEGDDLTWSGGSEGAPYAAAGGEGDFDLAPESGADEARETDATSLDLSTDIAPIEPPIDNSPLSAGSIDDADDVEAFLAHRTLITDSGVAVRPLDLNDSTVFTVVGNNGLPVLDALVEFWDPQSDRTTGTPVVTLRTTADGSVRFSPGAMAEIWDDLDAVVRVGDVAVDADFEWGEAEVTVEVEAAGGFDGSVPLDVHFVLDATGSMGDEIARLRENMTTIAQQIDALPSAPDVRFGMTVYRDEGDTFVTRTFDLTADLDSFLDALADVQAEGGGDYPEAMDEALADALDKPAWRRDGAVELMFVIADAPPQVNRQVDHPYTDTAIAAAEAGVKIFPVAASGTDDQAEYVMRDLAFMTGGRFVFLSYGVGGAATGDQTDIGADDYDELPLDQLVVRLVQDELAALTGDTPDPGQTTTTTAPVTTTTFDQ